jgi:type II secretory pathway predicted ATPase ExeA
VISGDIGTGKTTLIRRLLNQIDPAIKVGLISNTHQAFGDLMQWIALAFDLPREGKNKVELYRDFMDFIIAEYAHGQRTVLIIDEAQNMSAETLEELRMLSNVNADKDQVLQVILVGQRELRETLQRPDLIQFAQRIGVDYHLEPLSEEETRIYISHRCTTAGGRADLFTDAACQAVYAATGGVPRLINLLCDTTLVYGYAEQLETLDAELVNEVARDKLRGGLFPQQSPAAKNTPVRSEKPRLATTDTKARKISNSTPPGLASTPVSASPRDKNARLRVAIAAESELLRIYLTRLLSNFNISVVASLPLTVQALQTLDMESFDVLHVELDSQLETMDDALYELLENWKQPILFNDSLSTEASLSQPNRQEYGRKLRQKLLSLVPDVPQSVA